MDVLLTTLPRCQPGACLAPRRGAAGLFVADPTWGVIQPLSPAPGSRRWGQLEVIAHIRANGLLVDCRRPGYLASGTLPTAVNIAHAAIVERRRELAPDPPTVLFCSGPHCAASGEALRTLLDAGRPAGSLRYYRGGIHDWMTLGLPVVALPGLSTSR